MSAERFWRWRGDTLLLRCQVQPGASRDAIQGEHGGRLRIRVCAPPAECAANDRLCRVLGDAFGLPAFRVALESGAASRLKTVALRSPARLPPDLGIARDE